MVLKKIIQKFNILALCKSYGLSLWQCPQFLFLVMGLIIIVASLFSYLLGTHYIVEPELVALIVLLINTTLFVITFVITRNFERLAEISRMKSEFINIVTHQLRSPLTNLKWTVEFLTSEKYGGDLEKKEEYYSSLKENTGRMVELVNNLLIVSRLEKKEEVPFRKEEVSLESLVMDLILQFKAFAEASNIRIEFYPQENLPSVFIDPSQIKLVIENLIDNAVRYAKGEGKVEIRLERKNEKIYFEIKDSGVGIPETDKKYIFQKFFRSENVLRKQTQGSGLGLFIAKSVVEQSGGKIWFKSKKGEGTTFCFTLPIK